MCQGLTPRSDYYLHRPTKRLLERLAVVDAEAVIHTASKATLGVGGVRWRCGLGGEVWGWRGGGVAWGGVEGDESLGRPALGCAGGMLGADGGRDGAPGRRGGALWRMWRMWLRGMIQCGVVSRCSACRVTGIGPAPARGTRSATAAPSAPAPSAPIAPAPAPAPAPASTSRRHRPQPPPQAPRLPPPKASRSSCFLREHGGSDRRTVRGTSGGPCRVDGVVRRLASPRRGPRDAGRRLVRRPRRPARVRRPSTRGGSGARRGASLATAVDAAALGRAVQKSADHHRRAQSPPAPVPSAPLRGSPRRPRPPSGGGGRSRT